MRFPNAYSGVSKLRTAQILAIIVTALMVLAVVIGLSLLDMDTANPSADDVVKAGAVTILALGSSVLSIIALVLTIGGINKASKDEPAFKLALWTVIVNIVLAVITTTSGNLSLNNVLSLVTAVVQLLTAILVIRGIVNLADKLGDGEMVERGRNTQTAILVLCALSMVLNAAGDFFVAPSSLLPTVLSLAASVLSLAQFVVYLLYLNRARQMLV